MGNYNCYSSWDLSWIAGNMLSPVRGPRQMQPSGDCPGMTAASMSKWPGDTVGDDSGQFFGGLKKNTFFGGSLKDVVNFWEKNMFGSAEAHHMRSTCRSFNHPDSGRGLTVFSAGGSYGSYGSYAFRAPKAGRDFLSERCSDLQPSYPLVNIQKAIENGHWNSGFTHQNWWFSIVMLVYQRVFTTSW